MSMISPVTGRPTTPHDTTKPTAADQRIGSNSNRLIGTITTSTTIEDANGEPNLVSHLRLTAGAHLGSATGYKSVSDAVKALSFLTEGNSASAAVMRQGDRFFGYQLQATDLDAGLASGRDRADFESLANNGGTLTVRRTGKDTMLEAIVDGSFVHRFRG